MLIFSLIEYRLLRRVRLRMSALLFKEIRLMLKGSRNSNVLSTFPKPFNNIMRLSAIAVLQTFPKVF